ncbi:MAG: 6-bladed beta-propeller [Balneolales bacterium]
MSYKIYLLFTNLLMFFLLLSCSTDEPPNTAIEALPVEINERSSIISGELEDDLFFSSLYLTVTDQLGHIYTLDGRQNIIFKFDEEGNFIHTIGGEGRGPGEFQSVYSMIVTGSNKLLVYDYMSHQATIFDSDGSDYEIIKMNYSNALFNIRSKSTNELILPHYQDGHIIHIYNLDQQEMTASLISTDDVLQSNEEYEIDMLKVGRGSALALSDDQIVYAPDYYNGKIHSYHKSDQGWVAGKNIPGYRNINKAFTIHETSEPYEDGVNIISIHPKGTGYLNYEFHSWSLGLFPLNDGGFAHLSLIDVTDNTDEQHLVLEIFNNQELLKHAIIDEFATPYEQRPVWIDPSGYIYIADNRNEPKLSKFEVDWETR